MSMTQSIELHRPVIYKNQQAIDLLNNISELSNEQVQLCFDNGAVWLETSGKPQRLYDASKAVKPGHTIHCYCNTSTLAPCPFKGELVADFIDFSIWNKPSGMLCQGSKWGDHWALYRWIKQNYWPDRDSFITHRLDRYTSGLVIVAHNETTNKKFHRLFEQRLIKKTYRAIVSGLLSPEQSLTVDSPIDNKNALTQIRAIEQLVSTHQSLIEVKPETGRKHQIRVHLAEIGHPVINDRQYGKPPFLGDLMLQASELSFSNPVDDKKVHIRIDSEQLLGLTVK